MKKMKMFEKDEFSLLINIDKPKENTEITVRRQNYTQLKVR